MLAEGSRPKCKLKQRDFHPDSLNWIVQPLLMQGLRIHLPTPDWADQGLVDQGLVDEDLADQGLHPLI